MGLTTGYRVSRCLHVAAALGAAAHIGASRMLASDGEPSLRSLARMMGLRVHWDAYGALEETVRTGRSGIAAVTGGDFFDYLGRHPEYARIFDEAMTGKSLGQIGAILQ